MGDFNKFKGNGGKRFGGGGGHFGGGRGGFGGHGDGPRQMFPATCSKCGQSCEVPFKPTGDRPVFCISCFKSSKGGEGAKFTPKNFGGGDNRGPAANLGARTGGAVSPEQFNMLNAKLDKILAMLAPAKAETAVKENGADETKAVAKKVKTAAKKSKGKKK